LIAYGITNALYNFKGGVGKTTTAVNIAQYCALNGYKVLIIDMDSQASTSALFGIVGDGDLDAYDTVLPFTLYSEETTLDYAIRETHFDNVAIHHLHLILKQILKYFYNSFINFLIINNL